METKARYTLVGIFVITFSIAMVAFVLWLARYDINEESFKEYRLYMKQSVAGLKVNSIVYYKGLDVGTIKDIRINPKNQEEIEIILNISKPNLIRTNTYASIESQGITGNKTVELAGGTQEAQLLELNEQGYAIIKVKDSFFSQLSSQASNIGQKVDIVLSQISTMLNEKNLTNIEAILAQTNDSTKNFNALMSNLNTVVQKNVVQTLDNLDASLERFNELSQNLNTVGNNINELLRNDIKAILKEFKTTAKSAQNIDEVIEEFDQTLEKLNTTIDNFNENGGDMIFRTRQIKYGPGEKQ